mgnify:CR=1 FL=1
MLCALRVKVFVCMSVVILHEIQAKVLAFVIEFSRKKFKPNQAEHSSSVINGDISCLNSTYRILTLSFNVVSEGILLLVIVWLLLFDFLLISGGGSGLGTRIFIDGFDHIIFCFRF